jgi:hypothetical protein
MNIFCTGCRRQRVTPRSTCGILCPDQRGGCGCLVPIDRDGKFFPSTQPRPDHPGSDRAFVPASRQTSLSSDDIKTTMKEIPSNTAGAIVLTGHLRAKRPGESVRNARCLHRCTGDAHTRGPGNDLKKRWRLPQRKQSGKKTGCTSEGLGREMRRWKSWRCGGQGEYFTV